MTCSNCNKFSSDQDGLKGIKNNAPVFFICGDCLENTRVAKIAVRADDGGRMHYEQFMTVEARTTLSKR